MWNAQPFGPREKNFTEEDKKEITNKLRLAPVTSLKVRRMALDAEM